ncbi:MULTISPECIES: hypothetical protein [unclassified Pseudomonas]|uniref:hypothetical protein n=1 Tax=unclassified Pseudomonas TaxID=196821 RepID=UPI0021D7D26A|nr:hypothetical protein [Pseudomonas sp. YeP6b]UXZ20969.1 hypothetical protein KZH41_21060 [Pseudomonas sp. YeP6b]
MEKMLSHRTVAFLDEQADSSHLVYPEGGLLFSYQYAYKRAHCCLNGDMRNALYNVGLNKYSEITEQAANDLARFFQRALGVYTKDTPTDCTVLAACNLIDYLKEDLQHDLVEFVMEDGDYDMTATFEMASRSRNDYSRLELFWSVD